jgi:hypothetical protein
VLAACSVAAAIAGAGGAGALPSPVLQAQVVSIQRPSALVKYTTADYGKKVTASDDRVGTTTVAELGDFPAMNGVYERLVPEPRPVRTTVESGLSPRLLVEIYAVAVVAW